MRRKKGFEHLISIAANASFVALLLISSLYEDTTGIGDG